MPMIVDLILDSLRNAVLIAGLVVVMMMLIETLNINSRGGLFAALWIRAIWYSSLSHWLVTPAT